MYKICDESKRYNIIYKKFDKLYHDIAVKLGISDTVFWIFHSICEYGDSFTQSLLVDYLGSPKQTINSAITNLIKDDYLSINCEEDKKCKELVLTEKGTIFLESKILPIVKAENEAYAKFSKEELELFFKVLDTKYEIITESVEKLNDK